MNRLMITIAAAAIMAGCQTRITAEKYAEKVTPIQAVVKVNGEDRVITTAAVVSSGGWYATARSPLFAAESLKGWEIGVGTNGFVSMSLDAYRRDLSTNSIVMVKTIFDGSAGLAAAVAKAYATISTAGGSSAAESVAAQVVSYFKSKGGNESKSVVAAEGGALTVTDGAVTVKCDASGNCTDCAGGACYDTPATEGGGPR